MSFFRICIFLLIIALQSCKKESKNTWNITPQNTPRVEIVDISKKMYNKNVDLEVFKKEFPWFQGSVSDEEFLKRRTDKEEIAIYQNAEKLIDIPKLEQELGSLFAHIQYYFPKFRTPKVYIYSSGLQNVLAPIIYSEDDFLFIDISAFMGEKSSYYEGLDEYIRKTMNPKNIVPKVSMAIAESIVMIDKNQYKFIDLLIYEGKIMTLQDAFLPNTPDHLKINYTPEQYDWAINYQSDIWNYFVENNLLFSDDEHLAERFIAPAPFSKFYTEIDNESSPQIGIFTGWQICRHFFAKNDKTQLAEFLILDSETIFNKSEYKGK